MTRAIAYPATPPGVSPISFKRAARGVVSESRGLASGRNLDRVYAAEVVWALPESDSVAPAEITLHAIGSVDSPGSVIHSFLPEIRQGLEPPAAVAPQRRRKMKKPNFRPRTISAAVGLAIVAVFATRCRKSASTTLRCCRFMPRLRRWLRRRGGLLFAPSTVNTFRGRSGKLSSARVRPFFSNPSAWR
jgi:hypothetical protein